MSIEYYENLIFLDESCHATIDFETRGTVDLIKEGSYKYAIHPDTEAMCLSYHVPGNKKIKRWNMAHPDLGIEESALPQDLFDFIQAGGLVEAFNSMFERVIWNNIMVPRHNWPVIEEGQWRCAAAKARVAALPRDLDKASQAIGRSIVKDMAGRKLMLKMCKPRKLRKDEEAEWLSFHKDEVDLGIEVPHPIIYHETKEDLERLWLYCDNDVLTEMDLSKRIPDLSESELRIWQMDQRMNQQGVRLDFEMAEAAIDLGNRWKKILNKSLFKITGIKAGTRRQQVKDWLVENEDLDLPNTAKDTVEWYMNKGNLSKRATKVLTILRDVNKTSSSKYAKALKVGDPIEHKTRDVVMYYGAHTGRWAGQGIQLQNFPSRGLVVKDFNEAAKLIKSRALDKIRELYGVNVLQFLSHAVRGVIIPSEGKQLVVADYSSIEARCLLWLAEDEEGLELFRQGKDIYCDMAETLYGYTVTKKENPNERAMGKEAILGLGYCMGFLKFFTQCLKSGIRFTQEEVIRIMGKDNFVRYRRKMIDMLALRKPSPDASLEEKQRYAQSRKSAAQYIKTLKEAREDPKKVIHELAFMKYVVDVYRQKFSAITAFWKAQEAAAIDAVRKPGKLIKEGMISWKVEDDWLFCYLPSGRPIMYREPSVRMQKTSWGESKPSLRYMHQDGKTKQWCSTHTYGGKIVENITQAVARDLMAEALVRCDAHPKYTPTMSVHDEIVCEVDTGQGDAKEFEELMCRLPKWAKGCPVEAEVEILDRYKK